MTPSQTVGPFFGFSLTANPLGRMAGSGAVGEPVRLEIRVFDAAGAPVPDAVIELWQADASGKYEHPEDIQPGTPDPALCGFGRMGTSETGACVFETIRPGGVPGVGNRKQAPHINVIVQARGLLRALFTRIYFAGDAANEEDPVLAMVPEDRRATLLAYEDVAEPRSWRFEIHLAGDRETVFFEL